MKIWKGAAIRSDRAKGNADYAIAKRRDYLEQPYLCIVKAKKDDFEQGLAQCLAEMYACQWQNAAAEIAIALHNIYGIVTNATLWQFYRLDTDGIVYESPPYANSNSAQLLGVLHFVFKQCAQP